MTNNNRKITWKAIVAVVLVMASLFAMSSLVNAGIVELILGEEYAEVAAAASDSSSGGGGGPIHIHKNITKKCATHGSYSSFICEAPAPYTCSSPGCTQCQRG